MPKKWQYGVQAEGAAAAALGEALAVVVVVESLLCVAPDVVAAEEVAADLLVVRVATLEFLIPQRRQRLLPLPARGSGEPLPDPIWALVKLRLAWHLPPPYPCYQQPAP